MKKLLSALLIAGVAVYGCQSKKEEGSEQSNSGSVMETVKSGVNNVTEKAGEAASAAKEAAQNTVEAAKSGMEQTAQATKEAAQNAVDTAKEAASAATEKAEEAAQAVADKASETAQKAGEVAQSAVDKTTEAASSAAEKAKETANEVAEKANEKVEAAKQAVTTAQVDGQKLFNEKGCAGCHQASVESVGPSLKKIAEAYKGKEEELVKFLKGEAKPIVDPAKFGVMQGQISITKALSDEERKALADFILSH
ncbi:c-type cytochrome [Persephonella sp. IF05-L8]|uniref:c-type cytochrome n=1 Tax=Persephonella sp. IF05-L8 TaxID=1158338 RepID=UPI000AB1DF4F